MPETIEDLGRRVKAKYPGQYDDLVDAEVGRRVKAKYPGAYDDFSDSVEQPTFASRAWEQVKAPAEFAYNAVTHPIDTATAVFMQPGIRAGQAIEAAKQGNYREAAGRALEAIPVLGYAAEAGETMAQDLRNRNYGGAAGTFAGLVATPKLYIAAGTAVARGAKATGAGTIISKAADVAAENPKVAGGLVGTVIGAKLAGAEGAGFGALIGERIGSHIAERRLAKVAPAPAEPIGPTLEQAAEAAPAAAPPPRVVPAGYDAVLAWAEAQPDGVTPGMIQRRFGLSYADALDHAENLARDGVTVSRTPIPGEPPPQPIRPAAAAPGVAAIPSPVAAEASAPPPLVPDPVKQTEAFQQAYDAMLARRRGAQRPQTLSNMAAGSPGEPPPAGETLSSMAATPVPVETTAEGAPLSEIAKPKRTRKAKAAATEAPVVVETPETQAPALPTNDTYAAISRGAKSEKIARHLVETGRTLADVQGWGEAEWKQLASDLGDKKPPSADTIALVGEKLGQLEQGGTIPLSSNAQHAQSLFDAGVTYDDTLKYGPDQWKKSAAAAGVDVPKPADMAEIRGRLRLLADARGKVDVGATLGAYLDAQGVSEGQAVKATPKQRQEYGVAAGTGKPTGVQWTEAIGELRRRGLARAAQQQVDVQEALKQAVGMEGDASLSDALAASIEAAKKSKQ